MEYQKANILIPHMLEFFDGRVCKQFKEYRDWDSEIKKGIGLHVLETYGLVQRDEKAQDHTWTLTGTSVKNLAAAVCRNEASQPLVISSSRRADHPLPCHHPHKHRHCCNFLRGHVKPPETLASLLAGKRGASDNTSRGCVALPRPGLIDLCQIRKCFGEQRASVRVTFRRANHSRPLPQFYLCRSKQ